MRQSLTVEDLCCRITSGGTPRRDEPGHYSPARYPWIKTAELQDSVITECEEWISESGLQDSSAKLLPSGTVLMAMYGATVGKLGRLAMEATCNQAACAMITNPEVCDSRWLFYALLHRRNDIVGLANGAAQQNLSAQIIKSFVLATPELAEQQAIAEVLGALDDKIAANSRLVATLEERLRAVFRATIQDGSAPRSLREVLELNPPRLRPSGVAPEVPMQALPSPGITIGAYSRAMPKGGARFINGDTLLARITPCLENGKTGYVGFLEPGEVGHGSTEYIVMRSREGYPLPLSYFIATDASFRREAIQRMVGSSGRQRLKASDIADLMMPITDEAGRLSAFGVEVDNQFPLAQSLTDESNTLAQLRDTLLPALMDGRLRIRDAIEQVEGAL